MTSLFGTGPRSRLKKKCLCWKQKVHVSKAGDARHRQESAEVHQARGFNVTKHFWSHLFSILLLLGCGTVQSSQCLPFLEDNQTTTFLDGMAIQLVGDVRVRLLRGFEELPCGSTIGAGEVLAQSWQDRSVCPSITSSLKDER